MHLLIRIEVEVREVCCVEPQFGLVFRSNVQQMHRRHLRGDATSDLHREL